MELSESEPKTDTEPEDSVEKIDDPDKYAQRRRIEQILDQRQRVNEVLMELNASDVSPTERDRAYAVVVSNYIRDIEPLRQYYPSSEDRWTTQKIGDVDMTAELQRRHNGIVDVQPGQLEVAGLEDYLNLRNPIPCVAEISEVGGAGPRMSKSQETLSIEVPIPGHVTETAYRTANMWLSDIGFSAEPDNAQVGLEL